MSEEVKKPKLSPTATRIINIVVDVIVAVILVFALILSISAIQSKKSGYEGYTVVFGHAYLSVESGSMDPDNIKVTLPEGKPEGFKEGDLIKIKVLGSDEKDNLEVGDVISFRTNTIVEGKYVLNTHRIVEVLESNGEVYGYRTRGDANASDDSTYTTLSNVVGLYEKKASGIGHMFSFMSTSTGFFVCIVLPTLLVVVYCAVNLVLVILKERKVQTAEASEEEEKKRAELEEEIRQKVIAEMAANSSGNTQSGETAEKKPEERETEENPTDTSEDEKNNSEKEGQD